MAVACFDGCCRFGCQDLSVVCCDDGIHVPHTTIATFYIAAVEELVVPVIFGEMFAYQL